MRVKVMAVGLVLLGLILCACQAQQPDTQASPAAGATSAANSGAATAAGGDAKVVDDIKALLAKHDKALNDKSVEGVMTTFSNDARTVVLGTGQGERFVGQDAIKQAYTEIFKDYDAGTLETNCDWKTGGTDKGGTLAWLAATCQAKDSMKGVKRDYTLNVSAAVERQGAEWRFVMLHMSNATTNTAPPSAAAKK